ncbi:MAG: DUF2237 domain-containing protein [Acidobacteriota bacterium]
MTAPKNVLGGDLQVCSTAPMTGFFRSGCCETDERDHGVHAVCVQVTDPFLAFSKAEGNDLSTPAPQFGFPGLVAGDRWCVCLSRWVDALRAGVAPPILLAATHEAALEAVPLDVLQQHALDVH